MKTTHVSFRFAVAGIIVFAFLVTSRTPIAHADTVAQSLPFSQNWSNTGLITTNDNWSGVPGIIGYQGDGLTSATGVNPQTILADGSGTTVNVFANQTNPDTFISGGVAEFDTLANPVIALNGSGTADAPHIVISLNTSGATNIGVSYNLRDLDGSVDNAIMPVALQYRVGNTGNYTNLAAGFVPDATTGPSQATLVTPVSVTLPAACENQALVQLRIITTNAVGNDEWVGIDDIHITGSTGPTDLGASGFASPNHAMPLESTLLTVNVTPATIPPPSTNITVTADLSAIGGSATQQLFDDGTNGDVTAGDNTFSFNETVPSNSATGTFSLSVIVADAQTRVVNTSIAFTVNPGHDPAENLVMGNPSGATPDVANFDNYLIARTQYAMSYNMDKGEPNWVSWHLDSTWLGSADRQNDYRPDTSLPAGWYQVLDTDYQGSGFDRGHMCPSADRSDSVPDNSATFLMTNFVPQAPFNNQGPWEDLESYARSLVAQGNELYIIDGPNGTGGSGSNGGITNTVAAGHVNVPAVTWKVIIVIPNGTNDTDRVNKTTRTIAVIVPNSQSVGLSTPWRNFRVPVSQVEALTGYSFFTNVRPSVRYMINRRLDFQ